MSGWFQAQVVHTGRLPLFCFFVAFVVGFGSIRLSVRLVRARVRWWPGNFRTGTVHIHHMVFGVVFMGVGGVAELAAPLHSLPWRSGFAALFGLGTALVLDEFALILHLRDVYWTNEGRISVDAVFIATGVTALLLIGVSPVGVHSVADDYRLTGSPVTTATVILTVVVLFVLAGITLLKGKIWTALLGLFVPPAFIVGAIRLGRPGSPWARWRYQVRPGKLARATRREQLLRQPVIRAKIRVQDLLTGSHNEPAHWLEPTAGHEPALGHGYPGPATSLLADPDRGDYCPAVSRLSDLRRDELDPAAQDVWDKIVGSRGQELVAAGGALVGPFNAFVHAPDVGRRLSSLGAALRFGTSIDRRLSEVAIITVGARWQAEFEWWAHARMAREHGVPEAVVAAIGRGEDPPFAADDERTVYAVAHELADGGQVSQATYDTARDLLGEAGMVELVSLCGYYTLISFLLNAFAVPIPPGAEPMWGSAQ
jgi:alkylhydroperoxidase family enzyme